MDLFCFPFFGGFFFFFYNFVLKSIKFCLNFGEVF